MQVGNLVGPSTVLTAVSQTNPIKIYFPISEQEYLRMADGGAPGTVDWLTRASRIPLHLILADGTTYSYSGNLFPAYQANAGQLNLSVIWNLDFWGKYRRETEEARKHSRRNSPARFRDSYRAARNSRL